MVCTLFRYLFLNTEGGGGGAITLERLEVAFTWKHLDLNIPTDGGDPKEMRHARYIISNIHFVELVRKRNFNATGFVVPNTTGRHIRKLE